MKRDIYQSITDRIVGDLEKGVRPWHQPWNAAHTEGRVILPLRHNGVAYRGVNILNLWMASLDKGYRSPVWMTFKQAIDLGGCVRKGEKASLTVYADKITRSETDPETGEESPFDIHYMKGYSVFNVEQIDGLPEHYYGKPEPRLETLPRNARADAFFAREPRRYPPRRRSCLLRAGQRSHPDAALRELPRRGKLLRDARP